MEIEFTEGFLFGVQVAEHVLGQRLEFPQKARDFECVMGIVQGEITLVSAPGKPIGSDVKIHTDDFRKLRELELARARLAEAGLRKQRFIR